MADDGREADGGRAWGGIECPAASAFSPGGPWRYNTCMGLVSSLAPSLAQEGVTVFRAIVSALVLLAIGTAVRAGELDRDPAPAGKSAPAAAGGTEMDRESPQPAHGWRGYYAPYVGPGWGWGGYSPYGVSYGGFGFTSAYRPIGFGGYYGGFGGYYGGYSGYGISYGGFGYAGSPFYPVYPPFGYGGWCW